MTIFRRALYTIIVALCLTIGSRITEASVTFTVDNLKTGETADTITDDDESTCVEMQQGEPFSAAHTTTSNNLLYVTLTGSNFKCHQYNQFTVPQSLAVYVKRTSENNRCKLIASKQELEDYSSTCTFICDCDASVGGCEEVRILGTFLRRGSLCEVSVKGLAKRTGWDSWSSCTDNKQTRSESQCPAMDTAGDYPAYCHAPAQTESIDCGSSDSDEFFVLTDNILAFWPMNRVYQLEDVINNGPIDISLTYPTLPHQHPYGYGIYSEPDGSYYFDGETYVKISNSDQRFKIIANTVDSEIVNGTQDGTLDIYMYVKPEITSTTGDQNYILLQYQPISGHGIGLTLRLKNGKKMQLYQHYQDGAAESVIESKDGVLTGDTFQLIHIRIEDGVVAMEVDGVNVMESEHSTEARWTEIVTDTSYLTIGNSFDTNLGSNYVGAITCLVIGGTSSAAASLADGTADVIKSCASTRK